MWLPFVHFFYVSHCDVSPFFDFDILSRAGQNYWTLLGWERGNFFLITRALLVIKKVWSLDADWLSVSALSWFPALNGFWKWISDTHRFTVISSNVKENQHETKCSFGHLFASFIDRWGGLTPSQASQNNWIQLDCLSFVCKAVAFNELWICELFTVFC